MELGRDEEGRFKPSHEITIEDVFEVMEPLEPYTTSEITNMLDAPQRTVFHYLNQLADEERIQKKKPADTRVIWMRGK